MKRALLLVATLAALNAPGAAVAGGTTRPVDADVEAVATVMIGFIATNFEFNVYNCPAGAEMAVVWQAEQPDRPSGTGVVGAQPMGPSTGDRVQHLTLTAEGNFIPGEQWVGSGVVVCGAVAVPVEGTGTTHSQTGV